MADDIKKVGIQFTAEGAMDFQKSLQSVSQASKSAYTDLKLAQSQYDSNTSAVQKLTDSQKYLASQTEAYSSKVQILTQQLEEMKKDENTSQEAIAKKEDELKKAQTKLNQYEASLKEVNAALKSGSAAMKELGEAVTKVGDNMQKAGTAMSKYVTAPIVAGAAASVKAWKDVDAAYDTIIKKTGATGEAALELQGICEDLATSIPTSFEEAADAVGEVNTRFDVTGDKLKELSGDFIKFAQINGTSVSTSIDKVQSAMTAFGLSADDTGKFLDTLTAASQATGVSVDQLASDMMTNSAALKEMGYSASDAALFLANLNKSGIDSSAVMAGLKKAFVNATKDGKTMEEAIAELQQEMASAETDTEAMQKAIELFGNKAGPAIAAACAEGRLSFDELGTSMEDFAGTLDSTFEETISPIDNLKQALNNLKLVGYDLVETMGPSITKVVETVSDKIEKFRKGWEGLSPEMQNTILKIAGVAAAIGPMLLGLGKVTSGVGGLISKAGGLAGILGEKGLGGIFGGLTGKIGIIIAVIAALAAAFAHLWNTNEDFRNSITETIATLKENLEPIIKQIGETVSGWIPQIMNLVQELMNALAPIFSELVSLLGQILPPILQFISDALIALTPIINDVFGIIIQLLPIISQLIQALFPIFETLFSLLGELLPVVSTLISSILEAIEPLLPLIGSLLSGILTAVTEVIKFLEPFISAFLEIIIGGVTGLIEFLTPAIKVFLEVIVGGIVGFINLVITAFTTFGDNCKTIWNAIKDAISTVVNNVKEKVTTTFNNVKTAVTTVFEAVKTTVTKIWNGIKDAIVKPIETARDKIKSIIEAIKGFFSGAKFEWPKMKLPHFAISPSGWKVSDLLQGSIPKLSVEWYAKAMNAARILRGPTIFGEQNGQLLAGGEAGNEVITGEQHLYNMIREASRGETVINNTFNIYAQPGMNIQELAKQLEEYITESLKSKELGLA
jgi:phage-related minor tail protein